jgi:hypothetical protein
MTRIITPEDMRRPPRYATRRNPDLKTRGGKIGVLAASMGKPLLPHQQYIADVGTELNPPGSRLKYRYQFVVISLPRQTGKTTLMRPVFIERTMSNPGTQAFMCAQMGKDSTARWNDLVDDLETSDVLASFVRIKRAQGSERCTFPNASFISPFAPGPKALHGYSPPLVMTDEGWAFAEEEGANLSKAIRPAQITKTDRQWWVISAAGDHTSKWWDALVEAGRKSVSDPHSKMAYFEWSADETLDPLDPATWDFHPGLDGLITLEDLAEEAKPENNSHGDFLRGFLNRSTKAGDTMVIDLDQWDKTGVTYTEPVPIKSVVIAFEVAVDRTAASVYAGWVDPSGETHVALVETREGADWLPDYLLTLSRTTPPVAFVADDGGPTRLVTDAMRRNGVTVSTLSGKEASTAWLSFKAKITAETLRHDETTAIKDAISVAVERTNGDTTLLSRSRSLGPIDPLIAASTAAWYAERARPGIQLF